MANSSIQPYLFFGGRCEEALNFYKSALRAEVQMLLRYNESPQPAQPGMLPEGWDNKVMHSTFRVGNSTLMASDGCGEAGGFNGFTLSLNVANEEEAQRVFAALSEGGEIRMPLGKTFWSPCFGMVADRFGLGWMVGVETNQQ